jgi:hypothetical protein
MAPTAAAAKTHGLVPPGCSDDAVVNVVVVDAPDVVVDVGAGAGLDEVARKATTWFDEGASKRPAPTEGVGKWFAGAPMVA